jgi:hypothetical protein
MRKAGSHFISRLSLAEKVDPERKPHGGFIKQTNINNFFLRFGWEME